MRVFRGLENLPVFKNPVITIGTFDGVHLGHYRILERLQKKATEIDGESILITFEPHPRLVLASTQPPIELLTTLDEKIRALDEMKVDNLVIVPFTKEFSEITAQAYIADFLVSHFHPHTFIIGYDHHFGKGRHGNYQLLEAEKENFGFNLEEIPVKQIEHNAISSTKIREALHAGDIQKATTFLGKRYSITGKVVEGEKRGRLIGFPTANIEIAETYKLLPANGVYAVFVYLNDQCFGGMMNIGVRPTVSTANKRSIEVHLFDFHEMIYGEELRVEFIERFREEKKFTGMDELLKQLQHDKEIALSIIHASSV